MLVSYLLPFVDRGAGPLHQWVMLAQMASWSPTEIAFIGDERYFDPAAIPFGEEVEIQGHLFRIPDRKTFEEYEKVPLSLCTAVPGADPLNDIALFHQLLTTTDKAFVDSLDDAIRKIEEKTKKVRALLTWCNCPSLSKLALDKSIPLIHNELGPLRAPDYQGSVYFDFEGVNGNTSASRWSSIADLAGKLNGAELLSADDLRHLLCGEELPSGAPEFEIGVALQVEDDSNIVAYSDGWNSTSLVARAIRDSESRGVLVRDHPSGHFAYKSRSNTAVADSSGSQLEFMARCSSVYSINSSVLAECLLRSIQFRAFGDTSVTGFSVGGALQPTNRAELNIALNAYFIAYLVPAQLLFNPSYYNWRLVKDRSLAELHTRHLGVYRTSFRQEKANEPSAQVARVATSNSKAEIASIEPINAKFLQASTAKVKLDQLRQENVNLLATIREMRSSLDNEKEATLWLREQLESHRLEIDRSKELVQALNRELEAALEGKKWLDSQYQSHVTELAAMEESSSTQSLRIKELIEGLKTIEDGKRWLENQNVAYIAELQAVNEHNRVLQTVISDKDVGIRWLETKVAELEQSFEECTTQIRQQSLELHLLGDSNRSLSIDLSKVNDELKVAHHKVHDIEAELSSANERNEVMAKAINTLTGQPVIKVLGWTRILDLSELKNAIGNAEE